MVNEILDELSKIERIEDWSNISSKVNKAISEDSKTSIDNILKILEAFNEKLKKLI